MRGRVMSGIALACLLAAVLVGAVVAARLVGM